MQRLNNLIFRASSHWWTIAIILLLNACSFRVLFGLEDTFEALTGLPVFDTQNNLTAATLLQQLPLYTGVALTAYLRFAAFDWIFPGVAALSQAVLWALLLRINRSRFAQTMRAWKVPLWAFGTTAFDYLENISLLTILALGAPVPESLADAAIGMKRLKLAGLGLSIGITVGLHAFALTHWLYRRWRARRDGQSSSSDS